MTHCPIFDTKEERYQRIFGRIMLHIHMAKIGAVRTVNEWSLWTLWKDELLSTWKEES